MPPRPTQTPNPKPQTSPSRITWKGTPDLIGLQFTLQPTTTCTLPSNYTYYLHAWFLDQIRSIDPDISTYLHDNQAEKAFTLSSFLGGTFQSSNTEQRTITFSAQSTYQCHITALNAPVCKTLKQWLTRPPSILTLQGSSFQILNWQIAQPAITYEDLWNNAAQPNSLNLTFLSPTSFRKQNNHMPLPIPENLFHSYLRRWNNFAHIEFDPEDFLNWINECVVILRHDIHSSKVQPGKQGSVTGFIGTVQLGFITRAKQEPEYVQLVQALINSAPYFGTGHKITFGLGQTRLGWLVPSAPSSAAPIPAATPAAPSPSDRQTILQLRKDLIKTRITELEPQFLASRKRQGGDRAKNTARLWATIVAHQEAGDSLKAIAADLKLPYDTIKKYAQAARKYLE
jgi:CRISPR-associated endoribonuclease Cas6